MPSQLLTNDKVSFVVAKNFSSQGKDYKIGEDFPQEDARDIEVYVRARFVIPVVDKIQDKPRHWHQHIRPKKEVLERLARDRTQLVWPTPPDSDEVVNLDVLTHPELASESTVKPTDTQVEPAPDDPSSEPGDDAPTDYDPSDHTVSEVKWHLHNHPDDKERVLALEAEGRGRKGLLEE